MAIANNPERSAKDESDLAGIFDLYDNDLITEDFDPLDMDKIMLFAERFGQRKLVEGYVKRMGFSPEGPYQL